MCHCKRAGHRIDVLFALQAFTTDVSSSSACRTVGQSGRGLCPTARLPDLPYPAMDSVLATEATSMMLALTL